MAESKLDQIVKGAPPPNAKPPIPSITAFVQPPEAQAAVDPISTLPSSPPQIYLNLLILEASLRSQFLTLRARRRQYTFFLFLLTAWIAFFAYALFLRPREDGRGVGGSVYWVIEMGERVALMGGVVTAVLIWGTGQLERGVRWPRRWLGTANRGLRGINSKLIVVKGPWWKEILSSTLSLFFPYSSFFPTQGSSYHYVDHLSEKKRYSGDASLLGVEGHGYDEEDVPYEEDLAPGGDYVKLLLLPKPFSPAFRENWEAFRSEYWENENERRAKLRHRLQEREREIARQEGGWLWWTGWSSWRQARGASGRHDLEKTHPHRHHHHLDPKSRQQKDHSRSGSHSRGSSRSTTPTHEFDEKTLTERARRGSTASNASERRRKAKHGTGSTRVSRMTPANSRPTTPSETDGISRESSFRSTSSEGGR